MITHARLRLSLATLAAVCASAATAQPPGPPGIPADFRPYVPGNLRTYFVGLLTGPGNGRPITRELFIRHEAYLRRQYEAGILRLAGPFTDRGNIHGIFILSAPTSEAAIAMVAADPVAQEVGFIVEMHAALLPDLSTVRIEFPPPPH